MNASSGKTLVGWKAIAGYFSRDERTVMRWAASRGMPVQRVAGQARSSVYAWPEDLDAWLRRAEPVAPEAPEPPVAIVETLPEPAPAPPSRSSRYLLLLLAVVLAGLGLTGARLLRHPAPVAAAPPANAAAAAFHDPVARAAFLQATFDWNLRTRASLQRAISEYGEAVSRDPGIAAAYTGLANSYLLLREYGAMPEGEAYDRAADAAKVAASLDPQSVEARRALAFIDFWWRGDIAAARRNFTDAEMTAPGDPLTHHWYATALAANGDPQAAYREITLARSLDPTSRSVLVDYAMIAYAANRRDEARQVLRSLLAVDDQDASLYRTLASIALFEGRYRDYLAAAARNAALRADAAGEAEVAREAADYAHGGAPLMFEHMVDAARDETRRTNTGFFRLAQVAAVAGRGTAAIDALAPACTGRREPAAIGAAGDLWLERAVDRATVSRLCGSASLDGTGHHGE